MDPTIIAAAANGVLNTVGDIASAGLNWYSAQEQRKWSEKMYNKENAWNEEMWQKQNEYNTPAAQVQRLRDAGLNPMFYGLDGTGNAGALTAAQPLGYDRAQFSSFSNPIQAGLDAATRIAQISNIQSDTAKKNNENVSETVRREKMLAETENIKQQLNNLKAQQGLTESQKEQIDKAIEWTDAINEAVVKEKESSAALNESTKKRIDTLLEGEKILQEKNILDFDKKWQKIDAELKKIAAETNLDYLDIKNYSINHMNNGFMGTGLSINNFARATADAIESAGKGIEKAKNWIKDKFSK